MSDTAKWAVALLAALLIIALVAFARGSEERGTDTTASVTSEQSVATTAPPDADVSTTAGG
jgi:hypothetical protein